MVICLEQGVDLHMTQLVPLPLTVSCFNKIQIGFIFLVPAHPGSPGQRAIKWVCVCIVIWLLFTRPEQKCFYSNSRYSTCILWSVDLIEGLNCWNMLFKS